MALESSTLPENWRTDVTVPFYKSKGERAECKNFGHISFLSVIVKVCVGVLLDSICRVTWEQIDNEHGNFRLGSGYVDEIIFETIG